VLRSRWFGQSCSRCRSTFAQPAEAVPVDVNSVVMAETPDAFVISFMFRFAPSSKHIEVTEGAASAS
jgi:hypothetical protein